MASYEENLAPDWNPDEILPGNLFSGPGPKPKSMDFVTVFGRIADFPGFNCHGQFGDEGPNMQCKLHVGDSAENDDP